MEAGNDSEKFYIDHKSPNYYHPGKSGRIFLNKGKDKVAAYFGEIHPNIIKMLDIKTESLVGFEIFLDNYHLSYCVPFMNFLIIIGGIGGIAAWIIGPTKGLLIAAQDGCLSPILAKTNAHGVPARLLLVQAILVSLLSLFYVWMPST